MVELSLPTTFPIKDLDQPQEVRLGTRLIEV